MRLVDAQRHLRERGRIRLGYSTRNAKGDKIPHKLQTFMFSAPDRETLDQVAALFGGEVEAWAEGGTDAWRVTTSVASLNVLFASGMTLSQSFDQYRGGFHVLACDGVTLRRSGKGRRLIAEPCTCDPEDRACQLTTHLCVILPDLPGLGVWRLVTHSHHAAAELLGAMDVVEAAVAAGMRVPGRLFLTERQVRRLIDGKPETRKFIVPVLDLAMSAAALPTGAGTGGPGGALSPFAAAAGVAAADSAPPALEPAWSPVTDTAPPPGLVVSVADHLAEVERTPARRANQAPPIPATGVGTKPGADKTCSACGKPYGTAPLVRNPSTGSRFIHATCGGTDRGRGGTERTGEASAGADPAPAAVSVNHPPAGAEPDASGPAPATAGGQVPAASLRMMSAAQHRRLFALMANVWPCEGATGPEADAERRTRMLELCAWLGAPGLTSRKQIGAALAGPLLDALARLESGEWFWTDAGLVDRLSLTVVVPAGSDVATHPERLDTTTDVQATPSDEAGQGAG
jgi:Recombination directionality factor-like